MSMQEDESKCESLGPGNHAQKWGLTQTAGPDRSNDLSDDLHGGNLL